MRIMYALPLLLCIADVSVAGDSFSWQSEAVALKLKERPLGGQILHVGLDPESGWPELRREMQIGFSRHTDFASGGEPANRGASPISFGAVRVLGAGKPALEESSRTWCGSRFEIAFEAEGNELKMHQSVFGAKDCSMTVAASRLFPGVLIQAAGPLSLFSGVGRAGKPIVHPAKYGGFTGSAAPAWYAARTDSGTAIKPMSELSELPLDGLGRGWLLCWYGKETWFYGATRADSEVGYGWDGVRIWNSSVYRADSPFLILFSSAPAALSAEMLAGLAIEPSEGELRLVVLPVLGERLPRVEETEQWAARGLPEELIKRCDWWAAHCDLVPVDVEERYDFDKGKDLITITERFKFERVREQGDGRFAPVPPLLGTAYLTGFGPMKISGAVEDGGLFTSVGDFLAVPDVEGYELRFEGLLKYVERRPVPAGPYPERLVKELEQEVRRTVEAGHLAPWVRIKKNCDGWAGNFVCTLVHAMPGEQLWLMSEALPFLSEPLRAEAVSWMEREREEYPPERVAMLPTDVGARREWHEFSAEFLAQEAANVQDYNNIHRFPSGVYFIKELGIPAPMTPYFLAAYYEAVGREKAAEAWEGMSGLLEPYLAQSDWAGVFHQWPNKYRFIGGNYGRANGDWYGVGGVTDAHQMFAGALGMARLAAMSGDRDAERMWLGLFARMGATCHAMAKMTGRLYALELMTPAPGQKSAQEDIRVPYAVDEYGMTIRLMLTNYQPNGLTAFRDAVPELGALARDWFRGELMRYFENMSWHMPHWHLAWMEQGVENESGCLLPQDVWQTFMAYAWVDGKPAEWLERRLDVPWTERGDLYYMHKLIETIRAAARQ